MVSGEKKSEMIIINKKKDKKGQKMIDFDLFDCILGMILNLHLGMLCPTRTSKLLNMAILCGNKNFHVGNQFSHFLP